MVYEKIEPGIWKAEKEGDEFEGILLRVDQNTKYKSKVYQCEQKGTKKQLVIFGSTVLDDKMSFVNLGQFFKIVYKGSRENTKGQNMKLYEVFRDI